MRRYLLWLLLALLPWRLWAADAMALWPCHATDQTPHLGVHHADGAAVAPNGHEHAAHPAEEGAAAAAHSVADGAAWSAATCALCDLCHNPPMSATVPVSPPCLPERDWRPQPDAALVGESRAPDVRPPIA